MEPWQIADDPTAVFFDMNNIAFSHLHCNSGNYNRSKAVCINGHSFDEENTKLRSKGRECIACKTQRNLNRYL